MVCKGYAKCHLFLELSTLIRIPGVAYQLSDDDPLVDGAQCKLDAALMQTLGANAIRVYHVDSSSDHSACMTAFADAGIYLFVDLDTFNSWITEVCLDSLPRRSAHSNETPDSTTFIGTPPNKMPSKPSWTNSSSTTILPDSSSATKF